MKFLQPLTDKFAISLSALCAVHCLALPVLVVLVPSLASLPMNNEAFHLWMVIAVIPTSIFALTMGCKQHKQHNLLYVGLAGLSFLIFAVAFGESFLGETLEKVFTLIGASIIAFGHFKNYRLCQAKDECACPTEAETQG